MEERFIDLLDELLASCYACQKVWSQAMEARTTAVITAFALTCLITERKEHQEAIEKANTEIEKANANVWQSTLKYIMNMKIVIEHYDELPPGYCNKGVVKSMIDLFISTLKLDTLNYEATKQDSYFQLMLSRVRAMEEGELADQKAADVQKAEKKSMEFRLRIQAKVDARLLKECLISGVVLPLPTLEERFLNLNSTFTTCSSLVQASNSAQKELESSSPTEEDRTVLIETYVKSCENLVFSAIKCASLLIGALGACNENKRDEITQVTLKQVTKSFISLTGPGVGCQYAKAAILKNEIYQQLLITTKELGERETADKKASEDMVDQKKVKNEYGQLPFEGEVLHKQIVLEDRAEKEKAEEEAAVETAAAQKLTEEHRVLVQQQAEERAI